MWHRFGLLREMLGLAILHCYEETYKWGPSINIYNLHTGTGASEPELGMGLNKDN